MQKTYTVYNPYNKEKMATFNYANWEETENIIKVLTKGKITQKEITPYKRAEILQKLSQLLDDNRDSLAKIITQEVGKTITDSHVEIDRAIYTSTIASEEARRLDGEVLDSDALPPSRHKWGIVRWQPIGIVLGITPFNFPVNLSMHKIAPSFAAGNTFFFKPGPQNYLSGKLLTELCHDAGMPEDTIQMCIPDISEVALLIQHPEIACISFTGGVSAAKAIASNAGYKKLIIEAGGNDPLIVMEDADIELSVEAVINQRFATAGQRCTACKRLFVHGKIYEQFKKLLVEKSKNLKVGDPMLPETFIGPVVNEEAAQLVEHRIHDAVKEGAKIIMGGKRENAIIYPTILDCVPDNCELVMDETFGPVVPLRKFEDLDEIIPIINNTMFGLQAGVFTQQLPVIKKLYHELEVGTLIINDGPGFRAEHFPFGGVKSSGLGREGVKYAMREMCNQKVLVL